MRKLILILTAVIGLNVVLTAGNALTVTCAPQTELTQETTTAQALFSDSQDNVTEDTAEEAKKKRRKKKKKKNPVVKWVVGGVLTAAALVLYIATDGEGWHSR